jgi:O-antigen/teichoic acid export membrane protein
MKGLSEMSIARTVAKNTFILIAGDLTVKVFSFLLVIYAARLLGDVGFGKYSFVISFPILFGVVTDLGLSTLLVREVAREKSQAAKFIGNMTILKFFLSFLAYFMMIVAIELMKYPADTKLAVYIYGLIMLVGPIGACRVGFRAFERMEYEALLSILERAIIVTFGIAFLLLGYGLIGLIAAFPIATAIVAIASYWLFTRRFVKLTFEIDIEFWKKLIPKALPFSFLAFFGLFYYAIDRVMLSVMVGDAPTGWYNAAYNLILTFTFIPAAFTGSILPVTAHLFKTSRDMLNDAYEKSFRYTFIVGLPMAIGLTLLSDKAVWIIYGSEYTNAIGTLRILSWAMLFMFMNSILGTILVATDKEKFQTYFIGSTLIFNVILNALLIPRMMHVGASIATLASECLFFIFAYHHLSRHLHLVSVRNAVKPAISGLLMGAFVLSLHDLVLPLLVLSAAALYFLTLFALGGITKGDIDTFKRMLGRGDEG